ncbi:carbamoyltransferase HypF [Oceanobacter mangrovi]|uniref:carbamoyltransferase HypF n=1 Tax=Oceanobacter mangrovi TaxID=2862510 RepID=UPI001C8D72D3|nr:carbamoyltransferase HypF [Oceanobacter mangrovi]
MAPASSITRPDPTFDQQRQGLRLQVDGQVQGVGFRPFVYRLASQLQLTGQVFNRAGSVIIELVGKPGLLLQFQQQLPQQAPQLAQIRAVIAEPADDLLAQPWREFEIIHSEATTAATLDITPDAAPCADCLAEMADPHNRRYHYAFTNCTQCGPRYTLIRQLPYDRSNTSMAVFGQCPACEAEYRQPNNRRFHAQPNACPDCGPQLWLQRAGSEINDSPINAGQASTANSDELLQQTLAALLDGQIVALKGVGGFHLVCDATNPAAIARLRQRKQRPAKPFAVMLANTGQAAEWGKISAKANDWLTSPAAPVVVVPQVPGASPQRQQALAQLAPGLDAIGLMLPQSPLHWLLFELARQHFDKADLALVMTSGNRSGEPLLIDNQQALQQLQGIADLWLLHNRDILVRNDDSVVACMAEPDLFADQTPDAEDSLILRIGRGLAPLALQLLADQQPASVLALGGYLKNTIALNNGPQVAISQHLGDMDQPDNCRRLQQTVHHWLQLMQVQPQAIACDLHPEGFVARLARQLSDDLQLPLIEVPHHQAHLASVLADLGWPQQQAVLGLALDGFGLGWDGLARGGELLRLQAGQFEPLGALSALPMPGGDLASREPWRLSAAVLLQLGLDLAAIEALGLQLPSTAALPMLQHQVARGINCPSTTSGGRWFDAVAGLLGDQLGLQQGRQSYEGEAAMRLEALARSWLRQQPEDFASLLLSVNRPDRPLGESVELNLYPLFSQLVERKSAASSAAEIAAVFHLQLIQQLGYWIEQQLDQHPALPRAVVLSGGCLQNSLLRQGLRVWLRSRAIEPLLPKQLPLNDGGLALGQLAVACQQLSSSGFQSSGYRPSDYRLSDSRTIATGEPHVPRHSGAN